MLDVSNSQTALPGQSQQTAPLIRIALPVWRLPRRDKTYARTEQGVTQDELVSLFKSDLKPRGMRNVFTEAERRQLDIAMRLRKALHGDSAATLWS